MTDKEIIEIAKKSKDWTEFAQKLNISKRDAVILLNQLAEKYGFEPTIPLNPLLEINPKKETEIKSSSEIIYPELEKELNRPEIRDLIYRLTPNGLKVEEYFERPIYKDIVSVLRSGLTPYLIGIAGTGKTVFSMVFSLPIRD